jgi:hypothetical protein
MAKDIEIDLEKMVLSTYTKIAEWHNDDTSKEGLKLTAHDIVETILSMAIEQFDVKTDTKIKDIEKVRNSSNKPDIFKKIF